MYCLLALSCLRVSLYIHVVLRLPHMYPYRRGTWVGASKRALLVTCFTAHVYGYFLVLWGNRSTFEWEFPFDVLYGVLHLEYALHYMVHVLIVHLSSGMFNSYQHCLYHACLVLLACIPFTGVGMSWHLCLTTASSILFFMNVCQLAPMELSFRVR